MNISKDVYMHMRIIKDVHLCKYQAY
jgi:hypothetical protein